jgi:hypothetical protein
MRSVVLIQGLLRGMGREAPCEMLAIRESQSGKNLPSYTRCSVIEAPRDLPDGDYTVTFSAYSVSARKEAGLWVPEGAASSAPEPEKQAEVVRTFRVEEAAEVLPILRKYVA